MVVAVSAGASLGLMAVHLIKLAVGLDRPEQLAERQRQMAARLGRPAGGRVYAWTRRAPRRVEELVGQGSLYWVVKGAIRLRQPVIEVESGTGEDGQPWCLIHLEPDPVLTEAWPRKAFQGWRYLDPAKAPPDLTTAEGAGEIPPAMADDLRRLGLI